MTLRPRILTERLARVFRALYPLPGMAHGSKLLHQHRANVRATVSLPQIQYSLKNIKPLLMVILRLQKQSVFKQKTLCFSNPGFDKKIQVLGAVQVLESQVCPPARAPAHEYTTLIKNYPSYALTCLICNPQ